MYIPLHVYACTYIGPCPYLTSNSEPARLLEKCPPYNYLRSPKCKSSAHQVSLKYTLKTSHSWQGFWRSAAMVLCWVGTQVCRATQPQIPGMKNMREESTPGTHMILPIDPRESQGLIEVPICRYHELNYIFNICPKTYSTRPTLLGSLPSSSAALSSQYLGNM